MDKPKYIWQFDNNRRRYNENKSVPIYAEHWYKVEVAGETSKSWVLVTGAKISKKTKLETDQDVKDDIMLHELKPKVLSAIKYSNNLTLEQWNTLAAWLNVEDNK